MLTISRKFGRATAWIVDHSWLAGLFIAATSGLAIVGYINPRLPTELFKQPPPATATLVAAPPPAATPRRPPDVQAVDLTRAHATLVVQSDDVFTPAGAKALRHMVEELEALPYVSDVLWIDRVPLLNIFGLPEPVLPKSTASDNRFAAAKERALKHPLIAGQLMSRDGRTLLMMVNFDWLFVERDEDCTERLREVAEAAAAESPEVKFSVLVTGRVPIHLTMLKTHEANETKYQVIGYGVVLLMAVVLFRGFGSVLIVALGPALGVFWTLGILRFFDLQDNPFNDVVLPVMLSLVGLTDGVHLMVQIRRKRAHGMNAHEATRAALEEVGLACFLTSLTTAIGFWSLTLARHEIVQTFGWSCVLGVTLTFFAVLTVIPLACISWIGRWVPPSDEEGFIERHLHRVSGLIDVVLKRPKLVSGLGIAITAVCFLISLTLRPDERRSSYLPAGSESVKAMQVMDRALGGLEFSRVDVRWTGEVPEDSPEVLEVITQVDDLLKAEPLLGSPISIRSLVDALPGDGPPAERMSMLELLPAPLKRAFYTPESRRASVDFRVQDLGIAQYGDVFTRVEGKLAALSRAHPEFTLVLDGSAVGRWRNLYQIVVDLASSLGSAAIIIFVVLGLVYRSVRIGLIAVIPNVFPLAVTGAYLVFTGQSLEVVSVCAFTVCLGIAVDDTIHFLTRYQEEVGRSVTRDDAIRKAFTGVGTSMIMTTLVLVVGFSTVIFSDMRDQRIFATMGVVTLAAALLGDLIILPAMLSCFAREQVGGATSDPANEPQIS
ncbi:MAG TPA: efflux RND transporter permease subunit [Planctomycetaceae bacterium]|nr:efflux RND transporter permease subunit [Planctomycetaceae bacterium]